jgi:three-Cys-motif partner protein
MKSRSREGIDHDMTAPTSTIWDLEPHTRAKHEILRRYLQAWQAILTRGDFQDLVYIDGFAGPGRYSQGEDGSPIIALKNAIALYRHRQGQVPRFIFLFVEKDEERAQILDEIVKALEPPKHRIRTKVAGGQTFESAFAEFMDWYEERQKPLPPTFAFIDPFGWKGAPFSIVKKIMSYRSCEVFVNFMYEEINRFIGHPDQEENFDSFFGTPGWREAMQMGTARDRNRFLHDLYAKQLHDRAGIQFVRSFQMKNNRDVTDYYLFHGTNSIQGLKKMKEAMWRVDESGEFTFSDATDPDQFILFEKAPRVDVLRKQIIDEFSGSETTRGTVEDFVIAKTAFRETHYKALLKEMELSSPPRLTVLNPPPDRKPGTYADPKLKLRFM